MGRHSGKVAIVTGAGRGIAIRYAAEGARVVVASRTPSTVEKVVQELRDGGGLAVFLASPDSDYLTGMTFQLDGGMNMHP